MEAEGQRMKFLVVDDDWLTRGGVVKAIESIQPDAAVAEASSLHDAYRFVARATQARTW